MTRDDIYLRLRSYVDEKLLNGMGFDLDQDTPLLELGVLDSLSIVGLLAFLKEALSVSIPEDEILPQHFETLSALTQLVLEVERRSSDRGLDASALRAWMRAQGVHGIESVWHPTRDGGAVHTLEIPGEGPPWLLIPAIGQPSTEWSAMLRTLRGDQRAVAIDLVGFGLSAMGSPRGAAGEGSVEDQVEAVCEVLALQSEPAVLIAHGAGSLVALEVARRSRDAVAALVLIAFGVPSDREAWIRTMQRMAGSVDEMLKLGYRRRPAIGAELEAVLRESAASSAQEAFFSSLAPAPIESSLDRVPELPSLLIGAADDRVVSEESIESAAKRLRGAQIEWIARCGHAAPDERPESVSWFIRDFVNRRALAC